MKNLVTSKNFLTALQVIGAGVTLGASIVAQIQTRGDIRCDVAKEVARQMKIMNESQQKQA